MNIDAMCSSFLELSAVCLVLKWKTRRLRLLLENCYLYDLFPSKQTSVRDGKFTKFEVFLITKTKTHAQNILNHILVQCYANHHTQTEMRLMIFRPLIGT